MPPKLHPSAFLPFCRPRPTERFSSRREWPCNIPARRQVTPIIPAPRRQTEKRFPEGWRSMSERYCRKGHPRASLQPYQAFPRRVVPSHDAPRGNTRAEGVSRRGPEGPCRSWCGRNRALALATEAAFGVRFPLTSEDVSGPRSSGAGPCTLPRREMHRIASCDATTLRRPRAVQDLGAPEGMPSRVRMDTWLISQVLAQRQTCVPEGTRFSLWPISGLRMQTCVLS
jgi:hypothetical protein